MSGEATTSETPLPRRVAAIRSIAWEVITRDKTASGETRHR